MAKKRTAPPPEVDPTEALPPLSMADLEPRPAKPAAPKKPSLEQQADELARFMREQFGDLDPDALAILERRLLDPEVPGSLPIRLRDEVPESKDPEGKRRRWYLRWINSDMPGRLHHITAGQGYVKVTWDELQAADQIPDPFKSGTDQIVRSGEGGKQVLVKMPMAIYRQIKHVQREKARLRAQSESATKSDLQEAAAGKYGDEAAVTVGRLVEVRQGAPERYDPTELVDRMPGDAGDMAP